ncbi:MAG: glycosyltransferase family 4 protein [Anaerolineae bacterium]|nr:glycosyltransferase family 4 protein [Anaerolineae bacterium]
MKIVFISLFEKGQGGGAGRVAHEIAHYFNKEHDVILVCPGEKTELYSEADGLKVFGIRAVVDNGVSIPSLSRRNVKQLFDFLGDFQPDIIHAHDPALLGLIGQIWAKMHNVPFVHTAHILPTKLLKFGADDVSKILSSSLTESIIQPFITDFYDNCDAIVALNESAIKDIRDFGYEGQLFVIHNGRDLAKYEAYPFANLSETKKTLTFIGFLTSRKNQLYLLKMLRHLPDCYQLRFIGEPLTDGYKRQLEVFAQENRLDNIIYTGQIPHEEIPDYLAKTHVFVSASKMEVQSLVIIEALGSGTPVVGLSNETIDELVDESVGYRLPQDAPPESFAWHVEQICNLSQEEYEAMGQRARDRVATLDWANVQELTIQAYTKLLNNQQPVKEKQRRERLPQVIEQFPSEEVRDFLTKQLTLINDLLNEELYRKQPSEAKVTWDRIKRVPAFTWISVGLTMLLSILVYGILKPSTIVKNKVRKE